MTNITPAQSVQARIPSYHLGEPNHCPSCTRQHWEVGRSSAECVFCGEALPIAEPARYQVLAA